MPQDYDSKNQFGSIDLLLLLSCLLDVPDLATKLEEMMPLRSLVGLLGILVEWEERNGSIKI